MNFSPRTWILAAVAVLLFVAVAFAYRSWRAADADAASGGSAADAPSAAEIPALATKLQSADPAQAIAAAQSLSQSRSPEAVAPLLAAAQDTRPEVQAVAITSLARLQVERIDPAPFIQLVESTPQPAVRAAALDFLAVHKVLAGRQLMIKYLDDPDVEVRGRAYAGIHALTGRNYLFHADDPPEKRAAAIRAIRESIANEGIRLPTRGGPS